METIRTAYAAWAADRSRASLVRLLDASQFLVFGVCFEILRHRHDAEDATQRVLLELQKGLTDVRDADHFLHRVRLVAFRTALDTKRDRRRRMDRERKAADMTPSAPISDEVREAIHEAMASLDDESRALIIEHYFEKATLDQIAARRGVTGAAIWKRIEGIKGKLRHGLALAGLAAAASKAEACLEAATLVAPSTNLVGASTIAGGLMASKASAVTVVVIVATVTFGAGLGGGLAIQAAREPARANATPEARKIPTSPVDPVTVHSVQKSPVDPVVLPVESTEDRLKLAREIWDQVRRPRFWRDREAQDGTLPKLKRLGPDLTMFFIDLYRGPGLTEEEKREAVRLAVTCGGREAASLIYELAMGGPDYVNLRASIQNAILGEPTPSIPFDDSLKAAALTLGQAGNAPDRLASIVIRTLGDTDGYLSDLMEFVRSQPDAHVRMVGLEVMVRRCGKESLQFLKDNKTAISTLSSEGQPDADRLRRLQQLLAECVDRAIARVESGQKD